MELVNLVIRIYVPKTLKKGGGEILLKLRAKGSNDKLMILHNFENREGQE